MCNVATCDHVSGSQYVTIPINTISYPFNTTIMDDDLFESTESFELVINHRTLPNRIFRADPYSSTVFIENDEECKCLTYFTPYSNKMNLFLSNVTIFLLNYISNNVT